MFLAYVWIAQSSGGPEGQREVYCGFWPTEDLARLASQHCLRQPDAVAAGWYSREDTLRILYVRAVSLLPPWLRP